MAQRKGKRPTRPGTRRGPVPPPPPPQKRWWKTATGAFGRLKPVNKIILGAGSLAAAIAAILALVLPLLPRSAAENSARFTSVEAVSAMSLGQYAQTSHTVNLQSAGSQRATARVLDFMPTEDSSPSSAATGNPSPSATESPSPPASPSASPSPTASASTSASQLTSPTGTGPATANSGIRALPPLGLTTRGAAAYANKVAGLIIKADPHLSNVLCSATRTRCVDNVGYAMRIVRDTGCTQSSGETASEADCAQKAVSLLGRDTRTTPAGGQAAAGKSEPLGEFITAGLDLTGLKGQPVLLSWSIFAPGDASQLPSQWAGQFIVYRLVATTDDDSASVALWVPLPRQHGPYVVRLTLSLGDAVLTGQDSGPFS